LFPKTDISALQCVPPYKRKEISTEVCLSEEKDTAEYTNDQNSPSSWTWWFMPIIPALGMLRQENCAFKASLCYTVRPCLQKLRAGYVAQRQSTVCALGSIPENYKKEIVIQSKSTHRSCIASLLVKSIHSSWKVGK
jgi:hypothetical protein